MQTFLPYPDFEKSAKVLDRQRLGKQRVECLQILNALFDPSKGWGNHPATKMWRGHEDWLVLYGVAICEEWKARGYKDTCLEKIASFYTGKSTKPPTWFSNEKFFSSHRAALLFKNTEHYSQFGWTEQPKLDYVWPKV